jgi:hypothetical protein
MIASMRSHTTDDTTTITVSTPYARPVLFGAPRAGIRPARVTPLSVALDLFPQIVDRVTEATVDAAATVKGA